MEYAARLSKAGMLFVWFAATCSGALAAPLEEPSPELTEVIVTAQRTESSLQSTPIAVTAISGSELEMQGASTLINVQITTPNLSIETRSGAGGSSVSFSIRGMGVDSPDSSAAVGVYVDDVYFPSEYGNDLSLLDIDRVEVLRGPQGTLFGRNTLAGAVQYVSVLPTEDLVTGYGEASGGNDRSGLIKGALNLPVTNDLAVRVSGAGQQMGGYIRDEFSGVDRGTVDDTAGRLQVRWKPDDTLDVNLKAQVDREHTNGRAVSNLDVNPNSLFAGLASLTGVAPLTPAYVSTQRYTFPGYNTLDHFQSQNDLFAAHVSYQPADGVTLKSITAYIDDHSDLVTDFDQTPLSILQNDRGRIVDEVFSQEFQAHGLSFADALKWNSGLYFSDQKTTTRGSSVNIGLGPTSPSDDTRKVNKSEAVYGQASYNITSQLAPSLGIRYTHEAVDGDDLTVGTQRSTSYNNVSPSAGFTFQATQDVMLYVKASRGFRAGGFSINNMLPSGGLPFGPETDWSYEAGTRMEFFDRRIRVNPTIFFTDWKDIQFNYLVPAPTGVAAVTQNAGNAHLYGAELESEFAVTKSWTLNASASYLHAEYTSVNTAGLTLTTYPFGFLAALGMVPGSVVVVPNISLSSPLQQAPKYKFSLGSSYTQPLPNGAQLIGNIVGSYTASQESAVTLADAILLPAYAVVNSRLEYQTANGRVRAGAYANNLLDRYYLTGGTGFGKGYTVGVDEGEPARPREYGLTVRVSF